MIVEVNYISLQVVHRECILCYSNFFQIQYMFIIYKYWLTPECPKQAFIACGLTVLTQIGIKNLSNPCPQTRPSLHHNRAGRISPSLVLTVKTQKLGNLYFWNFETNFKFKSIKFVSSNLNSNQQGQNRIVGVDFCLHSLIHFLMGWIYGPILHGHYNQPALGCISIVTLLQTIECSFVQIIFL